jgi:hypothetical protein
MAINLLDIQPNKVSRDLGGYITYIYGPAGAGKTTFGSKMPKPLLLAAEPGYRAIPGIRAIDITSWGELKQVLRELKKPEVKDAYSSIICDTVDIMADLCQKYICNQLGIENIGDGGWTTNGWSKYKKEFEETFRTLAQQGYAIVFLGHAKEKTIKPQFGDEYQQICPALQSSAATIVENMCDIIGYAHTYLKEGNSYRVLTLRSADDSVLCKSRFKNIKHEIDFSYDSLAEALHDAIDSEADEHNGQFVTDDKMKAVEAATYDYEALMAEFQDMVGKIMASNSNNAPRISQIVEKYLGRGKKVSDTTANQAELVSLIVGEIKDELM